MAEKIKREALSAPVVAVAAVPAQVTVKAPNPYTDLVASLAKELDENGASVHARDITVPSVEVGQHVRLVQSAAADAGFTARKVVGPDVKGKTTFTAWLVRRIERPRKPVAE